MGLCERTDVCVVGSGATALLTALFCARAGKRVRLIGGSADHELGYVADVAAGGVFASPMVSPLVRPLMAHGAKLWRQFLLAEGVAARGVLPCAAQAVWFSPEEASAAHVLAGGFGELKIWEDVVALESMAGRIAGVPSWAAPPVWGASDVPDAVAVDAALLLPMLREKVSAAGVGVWQQRAARLLSDGAKVVGVQTENGDDCFASSVVLTEGWVSVCLQEGAGPCAPLPVRPVRCYTVRMLPTGSLPEGGMLRCENGGWVSWHVRKDDVLMQYYGLTDQAQSTASTRIDHDVVEWMRELAADVFVGLRYAPVEDVICQTIYVSPDFLPQMGVLAEMEGLLVLEAMGVASFLVAPLAARCAQLFVEKGVFSDALGVFSPRRYADKERGIIDATG